IRLPREILLAPCKLLQPPNRLVDALGLLLRLIERDRRLGFVLVLLEIHLELEELGQIATGEPAAAPAAVLLERDLDVGELGLRAQQVLQRLLLGCDRVVELDLGEPLRGRVHRLGRELEALDELGDALVLRRQLPGARAARERARLLGERPLQLREHLRVVVELLLVEIARLLLVPLADQVPRRDEDLLLAARDLVLLAAATAAAATAAGLARLREAPLERLHLDEVEIALGGPAAILGHDVVRNQIARLEARLGRRRLRVGRGLGNGLVELPAEPRRTQILDVEHRARAAARLAALAHGFAQ